MNLISKPQSHKQASPFDASVGRLVFMFTQLEPRQIDRILKRVHRALPLQVDMRYEQVEEAEFLSRDGIAHKGVVQLLYLIATQSYADILFALTYAETLAMMHGADSEAQGRVH